MRHLLQPRTLQRATFAAALTTMACYFRLSHWTEQPLPIYLSLSAVFICSIVMWSFVFAWHPPCVNRPIFLIPPGQKFFAGVTLAAMGLSLGYKQWLDPALRSALPKDYPADLFHWLATLLFMLGFGQLFLTFAPFDWLMRLCRNERLAILLTAVFTASIAAMRLHSHADAIPTDVFIIALLFRFLSGLLAAFLYLRGGIALAWWWTLVIELRLLPELL
jgi:hypothetical protein